MGHRDPNIIPDRPTSETLVDEKHQTSYDMTHISKKRERAKKKETIKNGCVKTVETKNKEASYHY